jgi:hypothetical protein
MWRLARVLLAVVVGVVVTASAASAAPEHESRPAPDHGLATLLGELWETVLDTPVPENPLAAGEPWCIDQDGVVAPFTLDPAAPPTCTVGPGTKIFVAAVTIECSTVEPPPFFGSTEAELRECARAVDVPGSTLTLTVDGKPVPPTLVETPAAHCRPARGQHPRGATSAGALRRRRLRRAPAPATAWDARDRDHRHGHLLRRLHQRDDDRGEAGPPLGISLDLQVTSLGRATR